MPNDEPSLLSKLVATLGIDIDRRRPDGSRTRIQVRGKLAIAAAATAAASVGAWAFLAQPANTDPQFATCVEAKDAGYGHYREGEDPEYAWYTDRNRDGVVCE